MENPILIERTRGDFVESFNRGSICIVQHDGKILFQVGNSHQVSFTRSALKPFQALPIIESGAMDAFKLDLKEIAVACGSHNAEKEHLEVVNSILAKCKLSENDLMCGAQMPTGRVPRAELRNSKNSPRDIHNNCSGKHAGFLALCVHMGWSTRNYLDYDHPCQQLQRKTCAEIFELNESDLLLGEDGCSAPNYATPLFHQALAYKNLISERGKSKEREKACKIVVQAMTEHSLLVAGRNRYCTDIIKASKGHVIGKTGADGIFCMAMPQLELGIAIKIDDGSMGPQYLVAQAIIEALGVDLGDDPAINKYVNPAVRNWNKHEVGIQRISTDLQESLLDLKA